MDNIIDADKTGNFSKLLDINIFEMGHGKSKASLTIQPYHLNIAGIVHGGVYASLLDTALGVAVLATLNTGEIANTIDLSIHFLKSVSHGTIISEGMVTKRGRKIAFATGNVYDENHTLLADAIGIWYIFPSDNINPVKNDVDKR
ncbi:MAG: PaaI family thioesterase [Candidatus Thermoplasmatota archaeon]|jgi:uncharacterized protein (TIGR00369 family)|nr:PaaI family thioesterase [Candidatus Thermoplasmatota archaeon]MCL5964062.1 PaaI family thioesterase [Candidatus Thermoplasmatota archaeon]